MTDWSTGYVVDLGYTFGYYTELNPQRMRLAFLSSGLAMPEVRTACELGFGQGLSTNIHAACSTAQWWGTDFNPAQAAFAQETAGSARLDTRLYDQAFEEFCTRADLPDFDYIGLHGIWSWVADANRTVLVDFLRRKLKVGGVLYISYNTMPGWAAMVPVRHLLTEHAEVMAAPGRGTVARIDAALEFTEKLLATNPQYARAHPQIAERIKQIKGQNRHYLAHEYFNRDWEPMPFAQMAQWLAAGKLTYACSAHYPDHVDIVNLLPEQQAFLNDIPDAMFRETVRDFMINQQFRRDYWVKGARRISVLEQSEALRKQRFLLTEDRPSVSLKVAGSLGEAAMHEAVYGPILDAVADHRCTSIGQIEDRVREKGIAFGQVVQAVMLLIGNGSLQAAQSDADIQQAKPPAERLNAYLMDKARGTADIPYLGSPVTGGGVQVPRIEQLFLLARSAGKTQPQDWAQMCWQMLSAQGQRVLKDGKALESAADNLAEVTRLATVFAEKKLPILKALQIV